LYLALCALNSWTARRERKVHSDRASGAELLSVDEAV
jgi:hypothetical protein